MRKIKNLHAILFCISLLTPINMLSQTNDYILYELELKTPITAVNISPDEQWILAGMENGNCLILDVNTMEECMTIETGAPAIYDIEMSPKMDVIFLAAGNKILLYDTSGVHIKNWIFHRNTMWSMDLDPVGKHMISTEVNKTFQLSDVYEGQIIQAMRGHEDITLAVEFSPDGKSFASGSNDKEVFIWDLESKKAIRSFSGLSGNIYDVAFSPDGSLIAAGSYDKSIRIWNVESGELIHLLKGHQDMILELEFSPDGKYLLSASADQAIKLWELSTGGELYAYLESTSSVPDICFLPGGTSFVSACMDGVLRTWEINPEIFVLKYFGKEYREELGKNYLFEDRRKGEKKSDYENRMVRAEKEKQKIIQKFYQDYLELQE